MVDWTLQNVPPSADASILEVGSGNGTLLFGLLEAGYKATTLYGIDYSAGAVKLAKEIAQTRDGTDITFSECDFLLDDPSPPQDAPDGPKDVWHLLLDKGTYDAIALGEKDKEGRQPTWNYPSRVSRLLKPGGHFLITCTCFIGSETSWKFHDLAACNFTEDELKAAFISEDTDLVYQYAVCPRVIPS